MKVAISNSGPLIHLVLVGLLDLVFKLYDVILIPQSVYDEVVVKGIEEGHSDAIILEQAITNEKIKVEKIKKENRNITSSKLHQGEINAILLALQSEVEIILLDDEEARIFARKLNIKVRGTLGILVDLLKHNFLDLDEAHQYLKKLNAVMYLSSDVYSLVDDKLNKLARSK
jgi:predicted nucleic acid-binding protein